MDILEIPKNLSVNCGFYSFRTLIFDFLYLVRGLLYRIEKKFLYLTR